MTKLFNILLCYGLSRDRGLYYPLSKILLVFLLLFIFSNNSIAQTCSVNAGVDATVCPNSDNFAPILNVFQLKGNQSSINSVSGTTRWRLVTQPSGANVTINTPTYLSSSVSGTVIPGAYTFSLEVECSDGVIAIDYVTYTVGVEPTEPVIYAQDLGCYTGTPFEIEINPILSSENTTLYVNSGIQGETTRLDANTYLFTPTPSTLDCYGNNGYTSTLYYSIENENGCTKRIYHTVTYNYALDALYANAVPDRVCGATELFAACSLNGSGQWTYTGPGTVSFSSGTTSARTRVSTSTPGDYIFTWTVSGGCRSGSAQVPVTFFNCSGTCTAVDAFAGEDREYCGAFPSSLQLEGSSLTAGQTGEWTQINGAPVTINNKNNPNTTVTGITTGEGPYEFIWLTYGNGCLDRDTVVHTELPVLDVISVPSFGCTMGTGYVPNEYTLFKATNYPLNSFYAQDSIELTILIHQAPLAAINADGTFIQPIRPDWKSDKNGWMRSNILGSGEISVGIPYTFNISIEDYLDGEDFRESIYFNDIADLEIRFSPQNAPVGFYDITTTVKDQCGLYTYRAQNEISTMGNFQATAGTDIVLNCGVHETTLAGVGLSYGGIHIGKWTMLSGPGPSPLTETSQYEFNPYLSNLLPGTYEFRYFRNLSMSECEPAFDDVKVLVPSTNAATNTAILDQSLACSGGPVVLIGTYDWALHGSWRQVSPSITSEILTTSGSNGKDTLIVTGLRPNTNYTYSFTSANGCGSDVSNVSFTTNSSQGPSLADIQDEVVCLGSATSYSLSAASIINGIGRWSIVSQPSGANARFSSPSNPNTTISNLDRGGVYKIKWTVSTSYCAVPSEDFASIVVGESVIPDAGESLKLCDVSVPHTSILNANNITSPSVGKWIFLAGPDIPSFSNIYSPKSSVTFSQYGKYVLAWESSIGAGCDRLLDAIEIEIGQGAPTANAGLNQNLCGGSGLTTLNALDLPAGKRGTWIVTKLTGSVEAAITDPSNPNSTVLMSGAGEATLTWVTQAISSFCPTKTDEMTINYFGADAGADISRCNVSTIFLRGNDVSSIFGATVSWSLVSGPNTPIITNPSNSTTSVSNIVEGTYIFRYTASRNSSCIDTDDITVNINCGPVCRPTSTGADCEGGTISLNEIGGNATSWFWSGPNGFSSNSKNPTISSNSTSAMSGTYTLTVSDAAGDTNTCDVAVTVNQNPTTRATATDPTCTGVVANSDGRITLSGYTTEKYHYVIGSSYSGGATYSSASSIPSGGVIASGLTNPTSSRDYSIRIFSSNGCYTDRTVTLNKTDCGPTCAASYSGAICEGGSISLSEIGGEATSWSWSGPSGFSSNAASPTISNNVTAAMGGVYTVNISDGANSNSCIVNVVVHASPSASPTTIIACGEGVSAASFNLSDGNNTVLGGQTGMAVSYHTSASNAQNGSNPLTSPYAANNGTTIYARVETTEGCYATASVTLAITAPPTADAGSDNTVCSGSGISLDASSTGGSGGYSYAWNNTSTLSTSTINNPFANPATRTTYTVTVTDSNGCTDTDQVIITVNDVPSTSCSLLAPHSLVVKDTTVAGGFEMGSNWTTGNTATDNNVYTSNFLSPDNSPSFPLDITGQNWNIPAGAIIHGIEVNLRKSEWGISSKKSVQDYTVQLTNGNNSVGSNLAKTNQNWSTTEQVSTYGGATNLWGYNWNYTNISNLGLRLQMSVTGGGRSSEVEIVQIDQVQITIYYTDPITLCAGETIEIAASTNADSYAWTIDGGGAVISGQGTAMAGFNFPVDNQIYQVCRTAENECGNSEPCCFNIKGINCIEICDDGIDNDRDNLIDCEDDDCFDNRITSVASTNPANCPDLNDGTIIITATGELGLYSIDNGVTFQTDPTFTGLESGSYNIVIGNQSSECTLAYSENPVILTAPICVEICDNNHDDDGDGLTDCNDGDCGKPVITSITPTNPNNCPDQNNGTITISATGSDLIYSINNGLDYQNSNYFENLEARTYTIRVQNSVTGCILTDGVVLSDSSCDEDCTDGIDNNGNTLIDCDDDVCGKPIIVDIDEQNPNNCPTLDNGMITIIAAGPNLEYSINNGPLQTARFFTNLREGDYTVQVRNAVTGCTAIHNTTISLRDPICVEICDNGHDDDGDGAIDCLDGDCGQPTIINVDPINPDNCPYLNDGQITITALGPNLEYSIDGGLSFDSNNIFSDLVANVYTIQVRNSISGCIANHTNQITLTTSICVEECDNGIDDDGNGYIDYQDDACDDDWPTVFVPTPRWLCGGSSYIFEVERISPNFTYDWNFGPYASIATATGIGPHTIEFDPPSGTAAIFPSVYFTATSGLGYEVRDTFDFQIRPAIQIVDVAVNNPNDCGSNDGNIRADIIKQADACIELSLDGGNTWSLENKFYFDGLPPGNYNVVARYCGESCTSSNQIITIDETSSSTLLQNDDFANICPAQIYTNSVVGNDFIRNRNVIFSIAATTTKGVVTMDANGSFEYIVDDSTYCGIDQFSYTACDLSNTCCATAFVTLHLTDTTDPILENIPADITISCDEDIPLPPFIKAIDNCPSINIDKEEVNTKGLSGCSLNSYTITRSWTATDICGNMTMDKQVISVQDNTAPDIFRIYTLPSGQKLVAGVAENVYEQWKMVSFPIQFDTSPLIFTQVVSNKDSLPIISRVRNVSSNQFELKVQQEENATTPHLREKIAWIAIESGVQTKDFQMEAKTLDITDAWSTIIFDNAFATTPALFTNLQSTKEVDPGVLTTKDIGIGSAKIKIEEETSQDVEVNHIEEDAAYLAIEQVGNITNDKGEIIGEIGTADIDHQWTRIRTNNQYYNPVIITQVVSDNEITPVLSRVNIQQAGSFDLRLQEWNFEDNNHAAETISYMIIEGSIPLDGTKICQFGTDSLELGKDIIAIDNCDRNVSIQYGEEEVLSGATQQTVRVWFAEDVCGNHTVYSQVVNCEGVTLRAKVYLQGALITNGRTELMRDNLRENGLLPLTEPYTDMDGFTHIGAGGGEMVSQELLDQTGPTAIVDWVFIELKDANNSEQVVATCSALLQRNGEIVTNTGSPIIKFYNFPQGEYYVRIRHRNHLTLETTFPYVFSANNTPYLDFNNPYLPVSGNHPRVELDDSGGDKLAAWSGDLNGDNKTIFQGPNNDIFYIFLQVISDSINTNNLSNFINHGYSERDFNLDGTVIFQGPNNDRSILLYNTVYVHPDNEIQQSNFVVTTAATVSQENREDCIRDKTQSFCDYDGDGRLNSSDNDDDNDGVADGNDANPYDPNSDSDGDGISDQMETGNDGIYHSGIDSDPLSPCDPHQDNGTCISIDTDGDGLYYNYPVNHVKYDSNDQNSCEPNGTSAICSCPDEDGDGYVFICDRINSSIPRTLNIRIEDWQAQAALGNECGPCQEMTPTSSCNEAVQLLNSVSRAAKGAADTGKPAIVNFTIPKGKNRSLLLLANFEREHCNDPIYCTPSNSNGTYLGDNYAFSTEPQIEAKFTGEGGNILQKNKLGAPGIASFRLEDIVANNGSQIKGYLSRESYIITLNEAEIDALLGGLTEGTINITLPGVTTPKYNADEAVLMAFVFENVDQSTRGVAMTSVGSDSDLTNRVNGNYTKTITDNTTGLNANQQEDGLLILGFNGLEGAGFKAIAGFTIIEEEIVNNSTGDFKSYNEGDGISATAQFRNGPNYINELSNLSIQSQGDPSIVCNGGMVLAFTLNSCVEFVAPNPIDNDGDGYFSNSTPYDTDDTNSCIPVVSTICTGIDNDGDGTYGNYPSTDELFDSDDSAPCIPSSTVFVCGPIDGDGDGYYGNAESSHANYDPDDTNSCVPEVGTNCLGEDVDSDGYFTNYPVNHSQYDSNDNAPCVPDNTIYACSPLDADEDGYFENAPSSDPYFDINDANACVPIVSVVCIGEDRDADGYFANYPPSHELFDSNDAYECVPNPSICATDQDGDGFLSDTDPDDTDACNPEPGNNNCIAVDEDFDGYFGNYPMDHALFDPNDTDNCIPSLSQCVECPKYYEYTMVCNNPGVNSEETVSTSYPDNYLNDGAYCGPCVQYSTIRDGAWNKASTWKNNQIPPTTLEGAAHSVKIQHAVTYNKFIKVNAGSYLYIDNGSLTINKKNLEINGGVLVGNNAKITLQKSLNIQTASSKIMLKDSELSIGNGYTNRSGSTVHYDNTCINVLSGNYQSEYNLEVLKNTCLTIDNGNLEYTGNTGTYTTKVFSLLEAKIHIKNGDFINQGKVIGNSVGLDLLVLKVSGIVDNKGNWDCNVEDAFCIEGNNGVPNDFLKVAENCNTIDSYLINCPCR